jgi:hypothetical protein
MGRAVALSILFLSCTGARAQSSSPAASPRAPAQANSRAAPSRTSLKTRWRFFKEETFQPMTLAAGAFNACLSQATNSDPQYGVGAGALSERFGASVADIVSQNFLIDFAMASSFHEDTRYVRRGPSYGGIWARVGYAISRAFVTSRDSGGHTFNWANLAGTTLSMGVSNIYYPPASRTRQAMEIRFGVGIAGAGLANLFPEFWPDFERMLQRHHLFPRSH